MSDDRNSLPAPNAEEAQLIQRYCRELLQRRLSEVAQLCGITQASTLDAFQREIGAAHDELVSLDVQSGFERTSGLTASRISLVGDEELELEIRIDEITARLQSNEEIGFWRVQLRYMTLLQRPEMRPDDNPLGLEPINRGLWALCREGGLNAEQNMILLDKLEEMLQQRLPDLYSELNGLLEHHRVEAAQVQIRQRGSSSGTPGASGNAPTAPPPMNALASLQQAIGRQFGAPTAGNLPAASGVTGAVGFGNAVLDASALVMLNHLMERMNALEMQRLSAIPAESSDVSGLQPIKSQDVGLPPGSPTSIALDTLSLIFEAIFATPELPDAVKAAIGRLQIPLLKRAILDSSFFADAQHPGRQAVNRLARAAIGMSRDTAHDHPLCGRIREIADQVRQHLEGEGSELGEQLAVLDTLINAREKVLKNQALPYLRLVQAHEAQLAADAAVGEWLRVIQAQAGHPEISRFLAECWQAVMRAAFAADATKGVQWQECDACAQDLLDSLRPRQSADERKSLMLQIPALIKRLNAGLDLANIAPEIRKPYLDVCFDLQTAALRPRPAEANETTAPASPANTSEPVPCPGADKRILEQDGKRVLYFGAPAATGWRSTPMWKEGDWLAFRLPDHEAHCGLICWQGAPFDTVVLFNNAWSYAIALSPALLEQQLRSGEARIVSNDALFDEAAQRALGQLRP
ncbi:MAG: DUF1631 family protein [Propionivibrio sp.]|nr:DUF1631 family protein [Propionivibrio sp.]